MRVRFGYFSVILSVEDRVENLESVLAQFMRESSRIQAAIHEDIAEIRASNARTDHQLLVLQQQAEEDRKRADEDRRRMDEDRKQSEQRWEETRAWWKETQKKWEEAEKDRKDFNRRLAEVTDSQGLMIENMVWPNLPRVASQVFGGRQPLFSAIRLKRRLPWERSRLKEIDLLAVSDDAVLVCEAKSKPTPEKSREFLQSLDDFKEFFPEYNDFKVIPMVASIAFDDSLLTHMTREGVVALGFGGETMEILNPEVCQDAQQGA